MLDYLRRTPGVRDVVVSGGDVANLPWPRLESFVAALLEIDSIRDIRLATQGADGPAAALAAGRGARRAWSGWPTRPAPAGSSLAIHTHVNAAQSVTPLVAEAAARDARGRRPRRAQPGRAAARRQRQRRGAARPVLRAARRGRDHAVLLLHVRHDPRQPSTGGSPSGEAQDLQHAIMGYLPGFATPRIVCDVPYVGKRWVHQVAEYDRERGISYWTKNYRTGIEADDAAGAEPRRTRTTTRSTRCPPRASSGGTTTARSRRASPPATACTPSAARSSGGGARTAWTARPSYGSTRPPSSGSRAAAARGPSVSPPAP